MPDSVSYDMDVLDLLVEWEERHAAGDPVTPEELCRDYPAHLETLREYITRVATIAPVLALAETPPVELRELPGYELQGEIGRGGMGVVYQARDLTLDRKVAIKVPFAGPKRSNRFSREGRALAALQHPNIVPVYTAGVHNDTPYIVMGYIDGHNLRERMPDPKAPLVATVTFFAQASEAIAYAHQLGVVHRDIKPSNILCKADGSPVISDFGLAALTVGEPVMPFRDIAQGETLSDETRLTRSDVLLGTPAYAAPEMQRATRAHPTPTVDVWSLGVVLYECLTGKLPYPNTDAKPTQRFAEPLIPPSRLRSGLPRTLDAIIQRCLAVDPLERYPSAKELSLALWQWLERQRRWRRRRRWLGVGLATCLAIGITAVLAWPESATKKHAATAQQLFVQLEKQGKLELIPANGGPATSLIRVNADVAKTNVEDGVFTFDAARPSMLELLANVPFERYTLTVEMRQLSAFNDASSGLYANYDYTGPEDGHRITYLVFSDMGALAHKYPGPTGQMGSALNLRCLRYVPPSPPPGMYSQHALAWTWYTPPALTKENPLGPWRTLRLTVGPNYLLGTMDDLVVKPLGVNILPATDRVRSPVFPKGGLGIYASCCKIQLRNCAIEKLP